MENIIHTAFGEIAVLLVLAAGVGLLGTTLRQPLVVSFIAVGLLAGPSGLDVVRSNDQIASRSKSVTVNGSATVKACRK